MIHTLALAPMEGVTDDIVRELFAEMGSVDYVVTEFIRVSDVGLARKVLDRECPELARGAYVGATPVHVQLLGGDPALVAKSAATAVEMGAHAIDLNFGCPAPMVNRHDGGASLLRNPCRVEDMTAAVRAAVPSSVSVSAKVRLGWDNPDDIRTIARAAEQGGASWITVHGRTRAQGYAPSADWKRIGWARECVSIPVIANGDLKTPADVAKCAQESGCDRFMIGRGAIERPEIFQVLRGRSSWLSPSERLAVLERFVTMSLSSGPDRERVTLCRCKGWLRAYSKGDARLLPCFDGLKRGEDLNEMRDGIARFRESLAHEAAEPMVAQHESSAAA